MQFTWTDNSHNETGFKLKRNDLVDPIMIAANVTEYEDTYELLRETTYTYAICSYNELGDSLYSAEASVTTLGSELPLEVTGISCAINLQNDIYGIQDQWIPNTNQLCRPFTIIIEGRDANSNPYEIPENLNIKLIAPEDPYWEEGAGDEGNNNIHRNKGTCTLRLYATDQEGTIQNYWLADFTIGETNGNDENKYWNIAYNEVYFTPEGIPVENCALNVTPDGNLRFINNSIQYTWFALRAEEGTGTIRPGDDILLRFGLADYEEIIPATAGMGDFFAIYDKKLLWRANLYIDEGENDWNNVNRWTYAQGNEWDKDWLDHDDDGIINEAGPYNGGQCEIASWTRLDDSSVPGVDPDIYDNGEVYGAVAYSWAGTDTPFDFNADMEDQKLAIRAWYSNANPYWDQNMNPHPEWANYNNTIAPDGLWAGYIFGMNGNDDSQPGVLTFNNPNRYPYTPGYRTKKQFVDGDDPAIYTTYSGGLDCTGFIHKSASYQGNTYTLSDLSDTRTTWDGTIQGQAGGTIYSNHCWPVYDQEKDILYRNLIVPGDIVSMPTQGHGAMVLSITYIEDDRTVQAAQVKLIESAYAEGKYMVVNAQSWQIPYNGVGRLGRLMINN
ncbi:MAG: hypothetical protein JXB88_08860 [Spirochaetales bacterium]|nr:hypothetical protein [Spirochaetales bacterium]